MQDYKSLCLIVRIILRVDVCRYTLWVEAYLGLLTAAGQQVQLTA